MKRPDPKVVIAAWKYAYRQAEKKSPPEISYANGWYRIEGDSFATRRKRIEDMTLRFRRKADKR